MCSSRRTLCVALASFITTAGFVYRRFDQRKRPILWRVIRNDLGPVLVDARFLRLFPYTEPIGDRSWGDYWDRIHNDAALYKSMLAAAARSGDADPLRETIPSLEEMTQLCHSSPYELPSQYLHYCSAPLARSQRGARRCAPVAHGTATGPTSLLPTSDRQQCLGANEQRTKLNGPGRSRHKQH